MRSETAWCIFLPSSYPTPTLANQWHPASGTSCYINHYFISPMCFFNLLSSEILFPEVTVGEGKVCLIGSSAAARKPNPFWMLLNKSHHVTYSYTSQAAMMFLYRRVRNGHGTTYFLISEHNQSNMLSLSMSVKSVIGFE